MALRYKDIVPWGRSYDEYLRMFDLKESELKLRILGCGDGPASFNSECNKRGGHVTSADPIYNLTKEEIRKRIAKTYDDVLGRTAKNLEKFKWDAIKSVKELGKIRMEAMEIFLDSYEQGKKEGRYIRAALPVLPFRDGEFDIALSSHFLFLYTDNLSYDFHIKAIREMLRVAGEVRIFPLLDLKADKSPYLQGIIDNLGAERIEVRKVDYEFQIGGNELLIIKKLLVH
jgi:hypothetical protein